MSAQEHELNAQGLVARVAVITCSDTRNTENDTSGKLIIQKLKDAGHELVSYQIIPDLAERLISSVQELVNRKANIILVNGGTGIAPKDRSYMALNAILESPIPGFGELFRMLSYEEIGSAAYLSRAQAGLIQQAVVFSMPGSTPAVRLAMDKLIVPQLSHLISELRK